MTLLLVFIIIANIFTISTSTEEKNYDCDDISPSLIFSYLLHSKLYFEPDNAVDSYSESNKLNDEQYLKFSQQYSTHFNESIATHPSIIAMIEYVDDIPIILSYASSCNYQVVIRSGGHQYSGLSSCNSANHKCIQIDVSSLDNIQIETEHGDSIVSAGPGVLLIDFYTELSKHNIFLPAGVCQTVRLGGHVQTNGYGLLTRSIGLLTDFLLSFDIIISNGTLIHVSKNDDNKDIKELFWAVAGGNPGNFGVIVNYKFSALKDENYVDSAYIFAQWNYDKITYKQIMEAYIDIHENPLYIDNNDVMLYAFILPALDFMNYPPHTTNSHSLMLFGIWTKNISMNVINYVIERVTDEPIAYQVINDKMSNLMVMNAFPTLHVQYPPHYVRAGYTRTNWKRNQKFIDEYIEDIDEGVSNHLYLQILFQSYGGKNSALLNGNIGAVAHRDIFLALEMFAYHYPEENDIAYEWVNSKWNKWEELLFDKEKITLFFGTLNNDYENKTLDQVYENYYKTVSMYNRLRAVKTKFDPIDLFHYSLGLPLMEEICDDNAGCGA